MNPGPHAKRGAALLSVSALLSLGPAVAQPDPGAQPALLQVAGAWRIAQARSEPLLDTRQARLDFHPDGRLTGHTSCNPLQARYTLDADRLVLQDLNSGRQRCASLQLAQEDRVLSALETAATARVRPDGLLELRDADGRGVLRATRWQDLP